MDFIKRKYWLSTLTLLIALIMLSIFDLMLGSYFISPKELFKGIFAYDTSITVKMTLEVFRVPRVITSILAGAALSVAGLLMQTLFQNPLAGPYVLGINSGASLMVALATMTSTTLIGSGLGIVMASLLGAFATGLLILLASVYVRNKVSLLLVGIMLGSFAGALVNVLQSYANPDNLKSFMIWTFGSLQGVNYDQLWIVITVVGIGILISFFLVKPLNLLLLGDTGARLVGVSIKSIRLLIIVAAALLTGIITAFCGPIAFVGLVVPNLVKMIYKTANHYQLMVGCILGGSLLIVICDVAIQLLNNVIQLPLNAITALIGAPVVVWIIIRKF